VLDLSDGPLLAFVALASLAGSRRRSGLRGSLAMGTFGRPKCGAPGPRSKRLRTLLRMSGRRPVVLSLENTAEDLEVARDIATAPSAARLTGRLPHAPCLHLLQGTPALAAGSVGALLSEPYARACEGQVCDAQLWQHWAQVEALRWTLANGASLVPRAFRMRACLIACPELWRRRQPISGLVCGGVDVASINRLHPDASANAGDAFRERFPCSLWQVAHTIASRAGSSSADADVLCVVDFATSMPRRSRCFPPVVLKAAKEATQGIQALVTWTEVEVAEGRWISSSAPSECDFRPAPDLQGVMLARNPLFPGDARCRGGEHLAVIASGRFDPRDGCFRIRAGWDAGHEF